MTTTITLLDLPDVCILNLAALLPVPDLLQLLSTHSRFYKLSQSDSFWNVLLNRDSDSSSSSSRCCVQQQQQQQQQQHHNRATLTVKQQYLLQAYVQKLPSVAWIPVISSSSSPPEREGHLACTFVGRDNHKTVCITGGFTDDPNIYLLNTTTCGLLPVNPTAATTTTTTTTTTMMMSEETASLYFGDWRRIIPTTEPVWRHSSSLPSPSPSSLPSEDVNAAADEEDARRGVWHGPGETTGPSLYHVYGASLTALDDHRAVRLGGFRGGGYMGECDQIALLTITNIADNDRFAPATKATWQVVQAQGLAALPRAYHTATLIAGRFLLVVGGMTSDGCIRGESILDTQTWTWFPQTVTHGLDTSKPTARHGHSMILDEKRNRLVMMGGGSGTNLLRSGRDNAEVWELDMGSNWNVETANDASAFQQSLPWQWKLIRNYNDDDDQDAGDCNNSAEDDDPDNSMSDEMPPLEPRDEDIDDNNDDNNTEEIHGDNSDNKNNNENGDDAAKYQSNEPSVRNFINSLTGPEKLCLGRCHMGFKVGPDTMIVACGSGRPSTNHLLAFDLATNEFFRPNLGNNGMLPPARFTAVGAQFGEFNSYVLIHGGYCTQHGAAIEDMAVLDLAPALKRDVYCLSENPRFQSYPAVTQDDVSRNAEGVGRTFGRVGVDGMENLLQNLFVELAAGVRDERGRQAAGQNPRTFAEMMAQMGARVVDSDDEDEGADDDDDSDNEEMDLEPRMLTIIAEGGPQEVRMFYMLFVLVSVVLIRLTFGFFHHAIGCTGWRQRNSNGSTHEIRSQRRG